MVKWEQNDIDICVKLIRSGLSYSDISQIVDRSESSIRNKLNEIGEKSSNYKTIKIKVSKCLQCGFEINHFFSNKRFFCSNSCSASYNNKKRINNKKECLNCGLVIKNKKKYCNNQCQRQYERKLIFEKIQNGDTTLYEKNYKNYLIYKYGEKCMKCGWSERHPITDKVPIQLEHKDGNSENNNLDNLELLCPNCHSLTETFGALNKGNGRKNRKR